MGKKHKKQRRQQEQAAQWAAMPQYGAWPGAAFEPDNADRETGPMDAGLLRGFSGLLRSRQSEQFLLGALLGAGAAWLLSDEEMRGKLVKAGMKLYAGIAGGFEEMKEQMADIKAEVEAEQYGGE